MMLLWHVESCHSLYDAFGRWYVWFCDSKKKKKKKTRLYGIGPGYGAVHLFRQACWMEGKEMPQEAFLEMGEGATEEVYMRDLRCE